MSNNSNFGWVGAGKYQGEGSGRRPAVVHAVRECIERGRNIRTGESAKARPATREEAERVRKCARCYD